ncbi:MAG TPA: PAS domain S-box protein [Aggregatilineales bacterium]|nr:PAS domain S-box protein [Aggregatilineales bacterium]
MKISRMNLRPPYDALLIALCYVVIAVLWVAFSDWLLVLLVPNPALVRNLQTYKGVGFVVLSGGMIYLLMRVANREQHRTEMQLRRLSRAVEQSASVVIITNDRGEIEYVNPRFTEVTGYTFDEVIGQNPRILKSGATSPEEYEHLWKSITSGHDWHGEFYNRRKDGGYYWVSATISPIRDTQGRITHFLAVQEDITGRKHAQENIERRNRELLLLNRVISAAASSLQVEEVLSVTCRELAITFNVPQVVIALQGQDSDTLDIVAEYGSLHPGAESALGLTIPLHGNPAIECIMESHEPCAFEDVQRDPNMAVMRPILQRRGVASTLLVPLLVRNQLVGLIELDTAEPRRFAPEESALAKHVAIAVSQALDNARLYQKVADHNDLLMRAIAEHTEELQRVKDRVEAILNNSPDAILLLCSDGRIETANPSFYRLFGIEEDVYNQPISQLVDAEDVLALRRALKVAAEEARVMRIEVTARRGDGSMFDAGIALSPFEERGMRRLVCVLRDITPLKEVERMKDEFVSNVSHELRTPITSLKLHHYLLGVNPDKRNDYMDSLAREIERLADIIENLLMLSRMDQDRISLELAPLDIDTLLRQYVSDRALIAEDRGLELVHKPMEGLPLVQADRGLLGQVLSILLTNAFNYTPRGGRVEVRSLLSEEGGCRRVGFSVTDTGYGIPLEEQPYVFDRFFRGQVAKETGSAGTGLGLAIAREIVERHGGRIEVSSSGRAGEGASFCVWLPADCE